MREEGSAIGKSKDANIKTVNKHAAERSQEVRMAFR
jgi:hypothetical protein